LQERALPDLQTLTTGIVFGESLRWHDDRLWFADWGTGEIIAVDQDGARETIVRLELPSFQPVCFDWLPDGTLVVASSYHGALLRFDGGLETYADLSGIANGWNEVAADGRGHAFVNGAGFDLMAGEQPSPGVVAVVTPDGNARQVADGIAFPNGMAVRPDDSTLIVAESYASKLTAFDIGDAGTLSNARVWAALDGAAPDGICLDADGAIWYADVPNTRCARVREGGHVLQTVDLDEGCFSCTLGGADGRTLFMVTREWRGMESARDTTPSGRILTTTVSVGRGVLK
jgi:sugar lactone lactonase YvrE